MILGEIWGVTENDTPIEVYHWGTGEVLVKASETIPQFLIDEPVYKIWVNEHKVLCVAISPEPDTDYVQ